MRRWAGLLLMASASLHAASAPDASLIADAHRAASECVAREPSRWLASDRVGWLRQLQRRAKHDVWRPDEGVLEGATIKRLRQTGRFGLDEVYRANCEVMTARMSREALRSLRVAEPVVIGDFAFAPYLDRVGDFTGAGLIFVREAGTWRWQDIKTESLARRRGDQVADALSARVELEDESVFLGICIGAMPPAPEPLPQLEDDEPAFVDDEHNAIGAARRKAAFLAANGAYGPPSMTAKALLAEVLIRSLTFDDAPTLDDPRWRSRIERAEQLLAELRDVDIDYSRLGALLLWLARAHELGVGGLAVDPQLSDGYRQLAADIEATLSEETDPNQFWADGLPFGHRFERRFETVGCPGT